MKNEENKAKTKIQLTLSRVLVKSSIFTLTIELPSLESSLRDILTASW